MSSKIASQNVKNQNVAKASQSKRDKAAAARLQACALAIIHAAREDKTTLAVVRHLTADTIKGMSKDDRKSFDRITRTIGTLEAPAIRCMVEEAIAGGKLLANIDKTGNEVTRWMFDPSFRVSKERAVSLRVIVQESTKRSTSWAGWKLLNEVIIGNGGMFSFGFLTALQSLEDSLDTTFGNSIGKDAIALSKAAEYLLRSKQSFTTKLDGKTMVTMARDLGWYAFGVVETKGMLNHRIKTFMDAYCPMAK
jgi:hypothetical protein